MFKARAKQSRTQRSRPASLSSSHLPASRETFPVSALSGPGDPSKCVILKVNSKGRLCPLTPSQRPSLPAYLSPFCWRDPGPSPGPQGPPGRPRGPAPARARTRHGGDDGRNGTPRPADAGEQEAGGEAEAGRSGRVQSEGLSNASFILIESAPYVTLR